MILKSSKSGLILRLKVKITETTQEHCLLWREL